MKRDLVCIICPNGCEMELIYEGKTLLCCIGNLCGRGKNYAQKEISDPERTITSSVKLVGGELPLASVRTSQPVPKDRIFDVMAEIRNLELTAPVKRGQVVIKNVLGLGTDVIITKDICACMLKKDNELL